MQSLISCDLQVDCATIKRGADAVVEEDALGDEIMAEILAEEAREPAPPPCNHSCNLCTPLQGNSCYTS